MVIMGSCCMWSTDSNHRITRWIRCYRINRTYRTSRTTW